MAVLHNRIFKSFLILCEGKDTESFIISYLNSSILANDPRFGNDIQTFDFGGVENLKVYLGNLLNMEGYDTVHHILVLRDAETDVKKAESMVQNAFRANGLPAPERSHEWKTETVSSIPIPATAFTLLPACNTEPVTGALEDLCWDILKDQYANELRRDVQGFIDDIKKRYGTISTHEHKSRLHTYFSVNEKYISLKIGEAANAGAFAWDSPRLDDLKKLITEGFV